MSVINKIVLAYSGGLDTSVICRWLVEHYDAQVITFTADLGQEEELGGLEQKARSSGASKSYIVDIRDEFLREYAFPTMMSGAVYERQYLLGTSFARPITAKTMIEIANAEGADAVAHGCTGKGNDQVRFELAVKALNPRLQVIAPWRVWDIRSREDAIDYAAAHGIPITSTRKSIYSRDRNIWHMSHEGGILEDPWTPAPEDVYVVTTSPENAPDQPAYVEIEFEHGFPIGVDGEQLAPVPLMERLNALGAAHGVGRLDLVENRLVGMKSRGIYETPGGTILYTAHQALETITLDRDTMHYKYLAAERFAELVYYGKWFTPLREALSAFFATTQEPVTGTVRLKLYKGSCTKVGCRSPNSLYREEFATFGRDHVYDQGDAEGFINLFGLPLTVRALMQIEQAAGAEPR
ncbi:MAG: argininosuccinate synthase [Anaerolineae bacterium]|nr:argininosuccinate synthase [Anaerolineae bacterium]